MLSPELITQINETLNNDGVIAFVTDTVWGIGCLPSSEKAVKKIYDIKNREKEKPLILMSFDIYPLIEYVKEIPKKGHKLIKQHFPGGLTVVVEKSEQTPDYITSNKPTIGIRVPDNKTFQEICKNISGGVLATTSANLSHEPASMTYEETVKNLQDKVNLIIEDFGEKAQGQASTVIGFKDDEVIVFRQGNIQF